MRSAAPTTRQAVERVTWIQRCGAEVVEALAGAALVERFRAGATVTSCTRRGGSDTDLLVVVEGSLELAISNAEGRRFLMLVAGPGHALGLVPGIDGGPRLLEATAKSPGVVLRIPRSAFMHAVQSNPVFAQAVFELLCAHIRWTHKMLASRYLDPLSQRLVRLLLEQAQLMGGPVVKLAQADLADMLGVTRQSINFELRALADAGVLSLGRSRVEIRDAHALERRAGQAQD